GASLYVDWRITKRYGNAGFWTAAGLFVGSSLLVLFGVARFLPSEPVVRAAFQTFTAQSGYLKTALLYGTPLVLFFVLGPFHAVLMRDRVSRPKTSGAGHVRSEVAFLSPRALGGLLLVAL